MGTSREGTWGSTAQFLVMSALLISGRPTHPASQAFITANPRNDSCPLDGAVGGTAQPPSDPPLTPTPPRRLRDRAAHVYFSLLQEALCSKSDVPQAAALLAQCIGCWAGEPGKGVHVDADRHVIEKLSGLVATSGQGSGQQAALNWTQVVDLAGTAGLGDTFALR